MMIVRYRDHLCAARMAGNGALASVRVSSRPPVAPEAPDSEGAGHSGGALRSTAFSGGTWLSEGPGLVELRQSALAMTAGKPTNAMAWEGMESAENSDYKVIISLTSDEALVLLELLNRWSEEGGAGETPSAACFESTAEGAVLNAVFVSLEPQVSAVFRLDYCAMVAEARARLALSWSYSTLRG